MENQLAEVLNLLENSPRLAEAAKYTVLGGGKRIRPRLLNALVSDLGGQRECVDILGTAVELLHAASLVHDDLPALDNDVLRRGQPTCHVRFGEGTAVLTGDVLPMLAFQGIVRSRVLGAGQKISAMRILADAYAKLCEGQQLDIEPPSTAQNRALIDCLKTGALFAACFELAGVCVLNTDERGRAALNAAGLSFGRLFQIVDDINDMPTGSSREIANASLELAHREVQQHFVAVAECFSAGVVLTLSRTRDLLAEVVPPKRESVSREE